jgi:hypothetical protein
MKEPIKNNEPKLGKIFVDNIQIELYHTWLNIFCGESVYLCLKETKTLGNTRKSDWEHTDGVFWIHNESNRWFIAFNWNKLTHGTIAHECFHATCGILRRKGIFLTEQTEEAYAYMIDFLVTKTTEYLKQYKIK